MFLFFGTVRELDVVLPKIDSAGRVCLGTFCCCLTSMHLFHVLHILSERIGLAAIEATSRAALKILENCSGIALPQQPALRASFHIIIVAVREC